MLRFTDLDRILKASRSTPITVVGKEIHFATDYRNFTTKRQQESAQAMEADRKGAVAPRYSTFLLYLLLFIFFDFVQICLSRS